MNGKEIARQSRQANDYGSFAGSFTAPRDRLMGADVVAASKGGRKGSAGFRVEEYKRPKFEVTLDAPKTAAKLNELVSLTGHAMNYTGAAVDGAASQVSGRARSADAVVVGLVGARPAEREPGNRPRHSADANRRLVQN